MVLLIALSLSQASLSSFVLSDSVDAYDGGDAVWISRSTMREYICPVVSINELKTFLRGTEHEAFSVWVT